MEFIEKLIETKDSIRLKDYRSPFGSYEDMGFRMFIGVKINDDVHLSVQASYGHYCTPRKTLPVEQYTAMELAILNKGEFVPVSGVTDNKKLINEFEEYYEGQVYGYVPVGLLEELYQDLDR